MLRKILINTLSNYVLKGILIILNIIAIPIFINELGAGFYGVIVLAGTLLANFIVFDLGFVAGVTKYVASFKAINDQNSIIIPNFNTSIIDIANLNRSLAILSSDHILIMDVK